MPPAGVRGSKLPAGGLGVLAVVGVDQKEAVAPSETR